MLNSDDYTILDYPFYNDYAEQLAEINKSTDKFMNKKDELTNKFNILSNRVNLYMSEFKPNYDCKKYSILFTDYTHIEIYSTESVNLALRKRQDDLDNKIFDEEYSMMFDDETEDKKLSGLMTSKESFAKELHKYLPKPYLSKTLVKRQSDILHKLLEEHKGITDKINYITIRVQELQDEYNDCMQTIIDALLHDEDLCFDIETDTILLIRNVQTLDWHLLYCKIDQVENIRHSLN